MPNFQTPLASSYYSGGPLAGKQGGNMAGPISASQQPGTNPATGPDAMFRQLNDMFVRQQRPQVSPPQTSQPQFGAQNQPAQKFDDPMKQMMESIRSMLGGVFGQQQNSPGTASPGPSGIGGY